MRDKPSDHFIAAILRAYEDEQALGKGVTPSAIWDHICMRAIQQRGEFKTLFEWDHRKASQNRIRTIMDVIEAGYVPGLALSKNARGGVTVVEADNA